MTQYEPTRIPLAVAGGTDPDESNRVMPLTCGFRDLVRQKLAEGSFAELADLCTWHGLGTNLSRRQSATMVNTPTDQVRGRSSHAHVTEGVSLVSGTPSDLQRFCMRGGGGI